MSTGRHWCRLCTTWAVTHLGGVDTFNRPTEKASPICDTPPASVPSSRMTIPN